MNKETYTQASQLFDKILSVSARLTACDEAIEWENRHPTHNGEYGIIFSDELDYKIVLPKVSAGKILSMVRADLWDELEELEKQFKEL